MKEKLLHGVLMNITVSLLIGIFCLFMLTSLGFIAGISINAGYLLISILAMVFIPVKYGNFSAKESVISLLTIFCLVLFSGFVAGNITDFSYDGQEYHQTGILFLKKGWNPIYTTAEDFFNQHWTVQVSGLIWVESYPKFYEIFAGNVFYLTDNIETGKMLNFLSCTILLFYTYCVLSRTLLKQNKYFNFLFSLLLAANPVLLAQFFTYYVDGLVYVYFMLMILAIIDLEYSNKKNLTAWGIFVISAILLANLKLIGIVYGTLICLIYAGYLYFYKKSTKNIGKAACLILIGILVSGINPYFTNIHNGKHFLHPIFGEEKIDIMRHNMPTQFFNKSMPYKLFMSTFSHVDNLNSQFMGMDHKVKLKIPFTIEAYELENLKLVDTRQCGFGVFWSGILIVSVLLSFFIRFSNSKDKKIFWLVSGILLSSVFLITENWWARYVPQFYAVPIIFLLYYNISKYNKLRISITRLVAGAALFSAFYGFFLIIGQGIQFTDYRNTQLRNMELSKREPNMIANLEKEPIRGDFTAPMLLFLDKYKRN